MVNLSEFVTGAADLKPSEGYSRPADDTYEYEITKIGIYKGKNAPSIFIDYRLGNGQSYRDWFGLPAVYGQETPKERQAIERYLGRLVSLGVPAESVSTFSDTDSLVGWRGVFDLVSTKGKDGKDYQNIRNIRAGESAPRWDAGFIAADIPAATGASPAKAAAPVAADPENPFE